MKEKRTYKRFDFVAFLAILGCAGIFLFEGYFILERYDQAVEQPVAPAAAAPVEAPVIPSVPVSPAVPVLEAPAVESAPAVIPVG